ncbi:MAG: tRNA 4-thiouridine(8) synthase ThiI, partial [Clostridia bacterium]|nr:tRNA 4-thiouridine(8) synthase ThiI [Clostridia bacterium]
AVRAAAVEYAKKYMQGVRTFKVEAKRADKDYPMISPEICEDVGAAILSAVPVKVDVHRPEQTVYVEIRDRYACVSAVRCPGAGGVPLGSSGRGLLLLSGGIDSPVAGYMMARRGITLDALHFEAFPYTSEQAKQKVLDLASILTEYVNEITVTTVSVRHIQEQLRDLCDEDYFTLLLRRFMMRIAERVADANGDRAIITGESLGQVASQTLPALVVTDCVATRPVFRPLIGSDKEEIVVTARKIGTFDTSILPFEDCCTVFTPRHPRTSPTLEKVLAEEAKVDVDALTDEAMQTLKRCEIKHGR